MKKYTRYHIIQVTVYLVPGMKAYTRHIATSVAHKRRGRLSFSTSTSRGVIPPFDLAQCLGHVTLMTASTVAVAVGVLYRSCLMVDDGGAVCISLELLRQPVLRVIPLSSCTRKSCEYKHVPPGTIQTYSSQIPVGFTPIMF